MDVVVDKDGMRCENCEQLRAEIERLQQDKYRDGIRIRNMLDAIGDLNTQIDQLQDAVVYLRAEIERLRAERDIYRKALLKMTKAPRMDQPDELPRYVAKDALRAGIKARGGECDGSTTYLLRRKTPRCNNL